MNLTTTYSQCLGITLFLRESYTFWEAILLENATCWVPLSPAYPRTSELSNKEEGAHRRGHSTWAGGEDLFSERTWPPTTSTSMGAWTTVGCVVGDGSGGYFFPGSPWPRAKVATTVVVSGSSRGRIGSAIVTAAAPSEDGQILLHWSRFPTAATMTKADGTCSWYWWQWMGSTASEALGPILTGIDRCQWIPIGITWYLVSIVWYLVGIRSRIPCFASPLYARSFPNAIRAFVRAWATYLIGLGSNVGPRYMW